MNLARIGTIALISASLLAAGCGATRPARPAGARDGAVERVGARVSQTTPVATFSGNGNTCDKTGACTLGTGGHLVLTGSFQLNPGIAIVRGKDAGSGVFNVGLVSPKPGQAPTDAIGASSIEGIGPFDGAYWLAVDGGTYWVAISAYGSYQISVEQPDTTTPVTSQQSFTGTGTQVMPFMALTAGHHTMTATSTGDLYVQLVSVNGDVVPADDGSAGPNYLQLATTGPSTKTFTVVLDGSYMLAIRTTSTETKAVNWSVAIN